MMVEEDIATSSVTKDSLLSALEDDSVGMTNHPVMPLVGSENVPITKEEDKNVE